GKRLPSSSTLFKLLKFMKLSESEAAFARALVGRKRATDIAEQRYYIKKMKALRPRPAEWPLPNDTSEFQILSKWYFAAIIEMTNLADFKEDPQWISHRLGGL